jgi:hypothetical protein
MKRNLKPRERIAILSDGTCETAENLVRAILAQFNKADAELLRIPKVRTEVELMRELDSLDPPYLIVYTFGTEKLRKLIWSECRRKGLLSYDILYPAVEIFGQFFDASPSEKQAILHSTQSMNYFDRMEAIEFTVKHDDGLRLNDLQDANLILTGVSRTSKTPTSMYLAHKGYKVANVPLVHGIEPPLQLIESSQAGVPVVMLSIEASALEKIRRSRLVRLGTNTSHSDTYISLNRIGEETTAALQLARRFKWPIIDVTNKAVEETAAEILLLISDDR